MNGNSKRKSPAGRPAGSAGPKASAARVPAALLLRILLFLLLLLTTGSVSSCKKEAAGRGMEGSAAAATAAQADPDGRDAETDEETGGQTEAEADVNADAETDVKTDAETNIQTGAEADVKTDARGAGSAGMPHALAKEMEDAYGVEILLGGDVPASYTDYQAEPMPDPASARRALETLGETLDLFPPSFFPSVKEGFCTSITICLAGELRAVDSGAYMESVHAFTTVDGGVLWLVVDAREPVRHSTLLHELIHVIDYRLLGMGQMREEEWNRLNPPGFSYYNAYLDEAGMDYRITGSREYTSLAEKDPDRIYFYDPYSRTYGMEDRARLMEELMEDDRTGRKDRCFSSPHVQAKLRFYFYTLRQAFGNGRWPEETAWEAALREKSGE